MNNSSELKVQQIMGDGNVSVSGYADSGLEDESSMTTYYPNVIDNTNGNNAIMQ